MPDKVKRPDKRVRAFRSNISDFQRGAMAVMQQSGLTAGVIAQALGLAQGTVYKQLKKLKAEDAEPFALSSDIIRNVLPLSAIRQAQAVLDDNDLERADRASYRMLKGGGVYQEQTIQTTRSVPDSEIMLGMTDLLISALEQASVPAEYSIQTDTNPAIDQTETSAKGIETEREEGKSGEETPGKPAPKSLETMRKEGTSLGAMIARTNAERMIAKADRNRTEGRPEDDETTTTT